jgi:hypothetical protein
MGLKNTNTNNYYKNLIFLKMSQMHYEISTSDDHIGDDMMGDEEKMLDTGFGKIRMSGYMKFLGFALVFGVVTVAMVLSLTAFVLGILGCIYPLFGFAALFPFWLIVCLTVLFGLVWLIFMVLWILLAFGSIGIFDLNSWFTSKLKKY